MKCTSCGGSVPDNAAFCPLCGQKLAEDADPNNPAVITVGNVPEADVRPLSDEPSVAGAAAAQQSQNPYAGAQQQNPYAGAGQPYGQQPSQSPAGGTQQPPQNPYSGAGQQPPQNPYAYGAAPQPQPQPQPQQAVYAEG